MTTVTRKPRCNFFRTVRNGTVRIGGVEFRPDEVHLKYDGRLDGHRFLFHRYRSPEPKDPFISLWGTEEAARDETVDSGVGPHLVDGYYPWVFWSSKPPSEGVAP